jgi:hypothetical protein
MNKITHLIIAGAFALALCDVGVAQQTPPQPPVADSAALDSMIASAVVAQESLPAPLPGSPDYGLGAGVLEALPRPRDTPRSLFGPAQPPSTGGVDVDGPYFVRDPLLDPSFFPAPGWFAGAEVQILKPHLINNYEGSVYPGKVVNNATGYYPLLGAKTVDLPAGPLDWTASPRVFAGYRLPAGFGEFMVAYRHLGTTGSGISVPKIPGSSQDPPPVFVQSRFAFDMLDLDYNSRQLSLWPTFRLDSLPSWLQCDMKWTLGLRMLWLYESTQGTQSFSTALGPGGTGLVFGSQSNNEFGIGPHAALELNHRLGDSGWGLYTKIDAGAVYNSIQADWLAASATRGPNGRPIPGQTYAFGRQMTPMINWRAGATYQPSPTSLTRVFLGYQYEVFWDLDRLQQTNQTGLSPASYGQYWSNGIVMQATFNW